MNGVSEADILAGHFEATRQRFAASAGEVLVLHETSEFSYKREDEAAIGFLSRFGTRKARDGCTQLHTSCGLIMHSSLVATAEGLPLGLAAIKFWTCKEFKGCNALKKKINPARIPIEEKESFRWLENLRQSTALLDAPKRCVHIGDREGDIYQAFLRGARGRHSFFGAHVC